MRHADPNPYRYERKSNRRAIYGGRAVTIWEAVSDG